MYRKDTQKVRKIFLRKTKNVAKTNANSIEDFYAMFGRDEMESILTKGGVSLMYTTQILRAIERDVKKKRKKKGDDEDSKEEEKKDEVNNNSAQTEDDDEPPSPPSLNISQSIAEVIETGVLVPEVTPRGSRKKKKNFVRSYNIKDNLPALLDVINKDLAGYVEAPDALMRRQRGTRRMNIQELTIFVRVVCSTDNGEDDNERVYRIVQKLFVACDRFALTGEFFNPNALVSILRFSEYEPNQICVRGVRARSARISLSSLTYL